MTDFTRKNHIIINNKTGESQDFKTINAAKKESRHLQKSGKSVRKA
jgi:hypothetical protein